MNHSSVRSRYLRLGLVLLLGGVLAGTTWTPAQEQVDKADKRKTGSAAVAKMSVRVRATKVVPEQKAVHIAWRRGGEGLGGEVSRGEFTSEDKKSEIAVGAWSAWLPLPTITGRVRGWEFPTLVVGPPSAGKGKKKQQADPVKEVVVEFEFAENGKVFQTFAEAAPKGATVGFAFPGGKLGDKGAADPEFVASLQGLSSYVHARRARLEKVFPVAAPMPRQFGVIGHLGGYGDADGGGKGRGSGYGVRHCNPGIVADECRTLRLLGMNGLKSLGQADAVGKGQEFRHVYWGGQSGHPKVDCPFQLDDVTGRVKETIADIRRVGAKESWAQKGDEIGVAAKEHLASCPRCAEAFRGYLRAQNLQPKDVGKTTWEEVTPANLWKASPAANKGKAKGKNKVVSETAAVPATGPEALRYYYTNRFMTYATAPLYRQNAEPLKEAGIPLFSMMGPTPSWNGHSLDWHEFYDLGANTAVVWETSNRDPRVWQWDSYLADVARGIATRHHLPIGALIKPHRGAPQQRMLAIVARGATAFEWYTYGPDYAKGDSFSQRPDLLEHVARAGRFLGLAEDALYGARWAGQAEVAFVSPRSSEIWGKATELGGTAFEDAKWVYLALQHAHIPVDILSEQQLAEGKLSQYKAIYIVGPNLRRDAAARVVDWVRAGGLLWTDALGLSRDEANQPLTATAEALGLAERKLESWGSVAGYRAVGLTPLTEASLPPHAGISWEAGGSWGKGLTRAFIGREPLHVRDGEVVAKFTDGKAAVVRRKLGRGEVVLAGFWAGLNYSARVRRADFDMRADFDPAVRALIAAPAIDRGVYRPVLPSEPLVEAVLLNKDGCRSVALINWSYRHDEDRSGRRPRDLQVAEKLRVALPGAGEVKAVRSLAHGPLKVEGTGANRGVVLPTLEEIDLLILE